MKSRRRIVATTAGASVALMAFLGASPALAASPTFTPGLGPTPPVASAPVHMVNGIKTDADVYTATAMKQLLATPGPMHGTLDGAGNVTEVWVGSSRAAVPAITGTTTCTNTQLCLWGYTTPYPNYGFSGSRN